MDIDQYMIELGVAARRRRALWRPRRPRVRNRALLAVRDAAGQRA